MKNKKLILFTGIAAVVIVAGAVVGLNLANKVEQKVTELTHEAGENFEVKAEDLFATREGNYKNITIDASTVNADSVGEYELTCRHKRDVYKVKVTVNDTQAPTYELRERYMIIEDFDGLKNFNANGLFAFVADASSTTITLAGTEKLDVERLTESKLKELAGAIETPADQNALEELVEENVSLPTGYGMYRGVIRIEDKHGNGVLDEIIILYGKVEAEKDDTDDEKEEVTEEETEETDNTADKEETTSGDSYEEDDHVEEETDTSADDKDDTDDSKDDKDDSKDEKDDKDDSKDDEDDKVDSKEESEKDEVKDDGAADEYIPEELSPNKKKVLEAGYYNVVSTDDGGFAVMVRGGEFKKGEALLAEHIESLGYEYYGICGGSNIAVDGDYYIVVCKSGDFGEPKDDNELDIDWDDPEANPFLDYNNNN